MAISTAFTQWLVDEKILQSGGIFVTGTDTGAGKTWIGARFIAGLRALGQTVIPRKPVESGWNNAHYTQTDTWQLAQAAGCAWETVCPNRLFAPLSPARAAQLEGKTLHIATLTQQCRENVTAGQFLLVEGAGGFYSPLTQDGLNADLAVALGLPVLLVAEDRVGCINHILLVVEAAQRRGLHLAGIVLNRRHPAPAGMDNPADLGQWLTLPILTADTFADLL